MTFKKLWKTEKVGILFFVISFIWYGYVGMLIRSGDEPELSDIEIFKEGDYWKATLNECLIRNTEDCDIYEITNGLDSKEEAIKEVNEFITSANEYINKYDYFGLKKIPSLILELMRLGLPILLGIIWFNYFRKKPSNQKS